MKTIYPFFLLLLFAVSSCSIQKRVHRPGFHVEWLSHKKPRQAKAHAPVARKEINTKKADSATAPKNETASASAQDIYIPHSSILEEYKDAKAEPCDLMILKTGEEVQVKVLEINSASIKYKKCENLAGPDYYIERSDVFMIKYANGIKEVINDPEPADKQNNVRPPAYRPLPHADTRTVPGIAIWAFVLSLGSIFLSYLGFFTLIAGFVLGFAALKQINSNPERYKGRGFAYAAIIFSGAFLLIILLVLILLIILIAGHSRGW